MEKKKIKIAAFNVNSIRARLELILNWLTHRGNDLDILCFQELKTPTENFPHSEFKARGYHCAVWGQKGYNGVATCSKFPPQEVRRGFGGKIAGEDSRIITTIFPYFSLINIYAPRGGEPASKKGIAKLEWYGQLFRFLETTFNLQDPLAVMGDFNIAPSNLDVFSPKKLAGTIGTLPEERQALARLFRLGLLDVFQALYPQQQQFTWWDYVGGAIWRNEGLRLDLCLSTARFLELVQDCYVDLWPRRRRAPTPSDHAPLIIELNLNKVNEPATQIN